MRSDATGTGTGTSRHHVRDRGGEGDPPPSYCHNHIASEVRPLPPPPPPAPHCTAQLTLAMQECQPAPLAPTPSPSIRYFLINGCFVFRVCVIWRKCSRSWCAGICKQIRWQSFRLRERESASPNITLKDGNSFIFSPIAGVLSSYPRAFQCVKRDRAGRIADA